MVLAFIFIYASVCSAVVKVLRTERGAVGSSAVILTRGETSDAGSTLLSFFIGVMDHKI